LTTAHPPDHRRLLDELRQLILSGEYAAGTKLPSYRELSELYGIDKNVVERVVGELRGSGLVETRHGSGTYVRGFRAIPRSSPGRLAKQRWLGGETIQDTEDRRRELDTQTGEAPAPDWAATALGLAPGTTAAFRDRRYTVDGRPVQLATSYLPVEIARGTQIMHTNTGPGGTYARLAELGYQPVYFTEFVRARMPLPEESQRLELPAGTPVLQVTRHAYAGSGRCVEVNRMILDGMSYLLDYSFPA
jgi:GntR family transcriptional regulator